VKDQRRKKRLTVGPGVTFTCARDIQLAQEQKGEALNILFTLMRNRMASR
jgi:hypothetical protein